MRIAIIGAGVSGIGTAIILQKAGHAVTIFDKAPQIGGVWAQAYSEVRLQNIDQQYHFSDFPWPQTPDLHPTAKQIMEYLSAAAIHFELDIRLNHYIESLEETDDGWNVNLILAEGKTQFHADFVISSIGQYSGGKNRPKFDGESEFTGTIITERDIQDLTDFQDKKVAVVGFGKSALDMATLTALEGAQVEHIFRTPRWTVPLKILGVHYSYPLFSRMGSVMMPAWAYPSKAEAFLHRKLAFLVKGFWFMLSRLFTILIKSKGWFKGKEVQERLNSIIPKHPMLHDLRSATALQPPAFCRLIAEGIITPNHAELEGFTSNGVVLSNGKTIEADTVILSLGSNSPIFPFMPATYREILEKEEDGVQLYRHMIHPDIPNFAFAGYNHGFLHIPAVEVGTVWLLALLDGELSLPPVEEMRETIHYVREWKRQHIQFEPSRSCAINTRYQQYLDIMLKELRLSPYRKSNPIAELFGRYGAGDYQGVLEEYLASREQEEQVYEPVLAMT
ncbi:MAG: NAD(P)/FAD-dependent oxidoreductase [Bacteroidota bacterium]